MDASCAQPMMIVHSSSACAGKTTSRSKQPRVLGEIGNSLHPTPAPCSLDCRYMHSMNPKGRPNAAQYVPNTLRAQQAHTHIVQHANCAMQKNLSTSMQAFFNILRTSHYFLGPARVFAVNMSLILACLNFPSPSFPLPSCLELLSFLFP